MRRRCGLVFSTVVWWLCNLALCPCFGRSIFLSSGGVDCDLLFSESLRSCTLSRQSVHRSLAFSMSILCDKHGCYKQMARYDTVKMHFWQLLGMWRSLSSNLTTFELRMFSVDLKFVKCFKRHFVEHTEKPFSVIEFIYVKHLNLWYKANSFSNNNKQFNNAASRWLPTNAVYCIPTSKINNNIYRPTKQHLHTRLNGFVHYLHSTNANFDRLYHVNNTIGRLPW